MAKNDPDHPEIARASQDVEPVQQKELQGCFHFGRGGAANIGNSQEGSRERYVTEKGNDLLDDMTGEK